MGGAFSCSTSACQYNKCLDVTYFFPVKGSASCRFSAEIFKLSEDHLQWTKVHPRVLSVTVSRKTDESGRVPVLELNANDLEEQQTFSLPILQESEIKRYSNRFVYWKATEKEIFALNVVSGADVDRLLGVACASCPPPSSTRVEVHAATVLAIRHGMVVEHLHPTFTKSTLSYDSTDCLRVLDEQDNCLFTTAASDCVVSLNRAQLLLCLSFPSRALLLQFSEPQPLRSFCATLLNESSMYLAKSREPAATLVFLQHRLNLVSLLINELPSNKPSHCSKAKRPTFLPPIVGVLYTLKYMLIYRLASLKNMLPYSDFVDTLYPPELIRTTNSREKSYVAHFIHLSCILHSCFSIPKHLEFIAARREPTLSSSHLQPTVTAAIIEEGKLARVVLELVQTEQMFLADLHQLLVQYVGPAELRGLEGVVRELHSTHLQLLHSLTDAIGELSLTNLLLPYTQIKDIVVRISALFINKCNQFKVYSEYASAHLQFQRQDNQNALLQRLNVGGQQSGSVESLMIKPIQRILKYPLFLAQIQDICPEGSMERGQCTQALERMQMLATYINEMQRIQQEYGHELDKTYLGKELTSKGVQLDLKDLLMFAQLKWCQIDANVECVAFVFKFFIVLMEKAGGQKESPVMPIWRVEVGESGLKPDSNCFSLIFRPTQQEEAVNYHLSCCHPDIKDHFVRSVKKGLKASIRQKIRPTSCQSSQSDWGYASGR